MTNTTTPTPPAADNPHNFSEETLADLAVTSGKMYDEFYDLLAAYQFDFTLEEKAWMLAKITADIDAANRDADENFNG